MKRMILAGLALLGLAVSSQAQTSGWVGVYGNETSGAVLPESVETRIAYAMTASSNANTNAAAAYTVATQALASAAAGSLTNLSVFSGSGTTGLITSAAGDAGKYLKADGTWAASSAEDLTARADALGAWATASNALPASATNGWEVGSHTSFLTNEPLWQAASNGVVYSAQTNALASTNFVTNALAAYLPLAAGSNNALTGDLYSTNDIISRILAGTATATIGENTVGTRQVVDLSTGSSAAIGDNSRGADQFAYLAGSSAILGGPGSFQRVLGLNGASAYCSNAFAGQIGYIGTAASATNTGIAALQIFKLGTGQHALTTSGGESSFLLGAGVASNKNAIVAGDGQVSHGDGSISAASFWANGTNILDLAGAEETDHVFTNWLGTNSVLSLAESALQEETDPVYSVWVTNAAAGTTNAILPDGSLTDISSLLGGGGGGTGTLTNIVVNSVTGEVADGVASVTIPVGSIITNIGFGLTGDGGETPLAISSVVVTNDRGTVSFGTLGATDVNVGDDLTVQDDVVIYGDLAVMGVASNVTWEYYTVNLDYRTNIYTGTNYYTNDTVIYTSNNVYLYTNIIQTTYTTQYVDKVSVIGGNIDYSEAGSILMPYSTYTNGQPLVASGTWDLTGASVDLPSDATVDGVAIATGTPIYAETYTGNLTATNEPTEGQMLYASGTDNETLYWDDAPEGGGASTSGLGEPYVIASTNIIAIEPTNGWLQACYYGGGETGLISIAGGTTNQTGSVRLDVYIGTNQWAVSPALSFGTLAATNVNAILFDKPAWRTNWTARILE